MIQCDEKIELYDVANSSKMASESDNLVVLPSDEPSSCVDGTDLDPPPVGIMLPDSGDSTGESAGAGEAALQLLMGGVLTLHEPGKAKA